MVLGAVRAWLLAAILPATWRGWDPHLPAVPGSHVHLRHGAQMFRLMLLVRAATRTEFTSTEVVYGVTGTDVTVLPEYGVSP
jgi:hypothetical protein